MILRGGKQLEEPKGVCQNKHSHYGKGEVIEKQVPTLSNEDKVDDLIRILMTTRKPHQTLCTSFTFSPTNG